MIKDSSFVRQEKTNNTFKNSKKFFPMPVGYLCKWKESVTDEVQACTEVANPTLTSLVLGEKYLVFLFSM